MLCQGKRIVCMWPTRYSRPIRSPQNSSDPHCKSIRPPEDWSSTVCTRSTVMFLQDTSAHMFVLTTKYMLMNSFSALLVTWSLHPPLTPWCAALPASGVHTCSPSSPSLNFPFTSRPLHELFLQPMKHFYLLIPAQKELSPSSLAHVPSPGINASSLGLLFSPSHSPYHTVMEEPI